MPEAHAGMMVTPSVRLSRPLGEGGMGSVWVADHLALRTQVVVKFIAAELQSSQEAQERFSREAAAAAQVKSPHVVQTFDHGISDAGVPYIVMELLEGGDLGAFLEQHGKLSPELALEIVAQLARALDRAHEKGIVHRDIKPGNIFLCDQGAGEVFVKLLDFGIAKGVEMPKIDSNTKTGAMIGSPFYMSPEQILGSKHVDHRSDLWSVGVVAFEALTGHKPFDAETMGGLAIKIHSEPLPQPTSLDRSLSPAVDAWFARACARNVEERFTSAKELAEALAGALGGQMPRSIEAPRISTVSNDLAGRAPTLAAGAATDAGVERGASPGRAKSRIVLLAAIVLVGPPAGYLGIKALFKASDPTPVAATAETTGVVASPPPSVTPSVTPLAARAKIGAAPDDSAVAPTASLVPLPSAAPSSAPAERPAPSPKAARRHTKPRPKVTAKKPSPDLPSEAPPKTTAKPAPTGHDIF